jgi:hypothetical protein
MAAWSIAPGLYAHTPSGSGTPTATSVRATHWAQRWLQLVVKYQQNPLRAARAIAHTHVAMHDAWVRAAMLEKRDAGVYELSAHRAASLVLQHFYPNEMPGHIEVQYAWMRAQIGLPPEAESVAQTVGTQAANLIIERSLGDGAGRTWPVRNRPADFPGIWQATYPMYAVNPVEAFAGGWQPWVTPAANRYSPPTAARPGSELHRLETQEVLAVSQHLTAQQREAAQSWNLESGSVTPPGVWMQYTIAQLLNAPTDAPATRFEMCAAVLATLSIAMQDALIACWAIKFRDWSERPITAIRRDLDKTFMPLLVTPGFPAYVSGHATVSGAAAVVLSAVWPSQTTALNAMAAEAAMSRLWGGIHFRSDNDEGLRLGTAVGQEVLATRPINPLVS